MTPESFGTKNLILTITAKWLKEFFSGNLTYKLNNKSLCTHEVPYLLFYSEAINTGIASLCKENSKLNICKKKLKMERWSNKIFFRFDGKFIDKKTQKVARR